MMHEEQQLRAELQVLRVLANRLQVEIEQPMRQLADALHDEIERLTYHLNHIEKPLMVTRIGPDKPPPVEYDK